MANSGGKPDGMSTNLVLTLILIFLLMTPADAFFRHLCFNPLGYGRIDPIVSPDKPSQHLHHLHGSGNLGIYSTDADTLLESNCTSCSITLDKSGYWAPAMYFQHANGTFELLTTSGSITIYYKTEKRVNFEDRNYTAFPKGFRMVAGDPYKRKWVGPWPIPEQSFWGPNDTAQEALASKSLGFNCLNYHRGWDEATFAYGYLRNKEYIDKNCLQGIRAEILFPSCWDGVNLDSPDHKSHVLYPTLLQDGACPKTHQVFLPILFYETIWNTQDFIGVPGQFVFSNGDPTGYGYHGDFIAAWEDGVLDAVMADPTCTDHVLTDRHTDGITEHCSVFTNQIQDQDVAAQCKLTVPDKLVHERVVGHIDALPGNIAITGFRHDPGTEPEDYDFDPAPPIPPVESDSAAPPVQSNPSPVVPPPVAPPSHVSSSAVYAPSKASATITPVAAPQVGRFTTTSTYMSNGIKYVMVVVKEIVTVTSLAPAQTAATTTAGTVDRNASTPILNRRLHGHGHGHARHNIV